MVLAEPSKVYMIKSWMKIRQQGLFFFISYLLYPWDSLATLTLSCGTYDVDLVSSPAHNFRIHNLFCSPYSKIPASKTNKTPKTKKVKISYPYASNSLDFSSSRILV